MCLLTYFPPDTQPDAQLLRNGGQFNDDGHGWAIVANGSIITYKSLNLNQAIDNFVATRKIYPEGPALFHSRLSTHGSISVDNCHPFVVNGDSRTVIGHNGIFPKSVQPGKDDNRSDTRVLAEDFLGKRSHLLFATEKQRKQLAGWMGKYNKAVILNVNPAYSFSSVIINEQQGIWHNGIWYSNDAFEGWTSRIYTIQPKHASHYEWDTYDRCTHCLSYGTIKKITHICSFCEVCNDCDEPSDSCLCYAPTKMIEGDKADDSDRYVKWWETKTESTVLGYSDPLINSPTQDDDSAGNQANWTIQTINAKPIVRYKTDKTVPCVGCGFSHICSCKDKPDTTLVEDDPDECCEGCTFYDNSDNTNVTT